MIFKINAFCVLLVGFADQQIFYNSDKQY